jgi:hypothetical protein
MNPLQFFRHENGSNRRLQSRRRPLVEDLEGRQLQSGIVGNHIGAGVVPAGIQGNHIGAGVVPASIQGNHIGYGVVPAGIQGNHIG